MIGILDCKNHQSPISIIVSQNDSFTVYCQICFQIITKNSPQIQAVRLNTHTLDLFDSFTTYVYEKLPSWYQKIRSNSSQAVFEESTHDQNTYPFRKDEQISKKIAIQIIEEYRHLIKSNRDSVLALRSPQILYHHEFLKDIYNLIMKSWRLCAAFIANNYANKLKLVDHRQRELKITGTLIDEIQKQRLRMVNQKLQFLIIKTHPLLQQMNRVNQGGNTNGNYDFGHEDQQISQLDGYQGPVLIKKIESFEQINSYINSAKTIDEKGNQPTFIRAKNMKKSKLFDQKDFYQANLKYEALLKDLESVKLQNDELRSQNYILKSQSQMCHQQNKLLRKKCQQYENELKRHRYGDKNHNLNRIQVPEHKVKQAKELQNCKQDIKSLMEYVMNLSNSPSIDKSLLNKTLSQLKSINFKP